MKKALLAAGIILALSPAVVLADQVVTEKGTVSSKRPAAQNEQEQVVDNPDPKDLDSD